MTIRRRRALQPIQSWDSYPHAFVPVAALALRWGQQGQTIRRWVRVGLLRGKRFGRTIRVERDSAIEFEAM